VFNVKAARNAGESGKGEAQANYDRLELEAVQGVANVSVSAGERTEDMEGLYAVNATNEKQATEVHDLNQAKQQAQLESLLAARGQRREAVARNAEKAPATAVDIDDDDEEEVQVDEDDGADDGSFEGQGTMDYYTDEVPKPNGSEVATGQ
jgi:hypothetical protein